MVEADIQLENNFSCFNENSIKLLDGINPKNIANYFEMVVKGSPVLEFTITNEDNKILSHRALNVEIG